MLIRPSLLQDPRPSTVVKPPATVGWASVNLGLIVGLSIAALVLSCVALSGENQGKRPNGIRTFAVPSGGVAGCSATPPGEQVFSETRRLPSARGVASCTPERV